MRKNVLIVSAVFDPEPLTTAQMNYDLALKLSNKHNVTVLRPQPTRPIGHDYTEYNINYPFTCVTLESYTCPASRLVGRMRESISFGLRCRRYILENRRNIDFVYNASWHIFGFWLVAKTCVACGIPYILPVQDIYPESLFTSGKYPKFIKYLIKSLLLPVDRYCQRKASRVRTITSEMADYLSDTRKISREQYLVVNNWHNDNDIPYEPINVNDSIVFSYVGSVNNHSNVELLIRAFHKAAIRNSKLKIYGGGSNLSKCKELVDELQTNNIVFDYVERHKVPIVQSAATVLILALPSGNGTLCLPSKITSYMFSGRPLLVSVDHNSAAARYIREAKCGICVNPDNIEALVEGFVSFSKMSIEELQTMGCNSRFYASENLTKEHNLSCVYDAIEDVIMW